MKKASKKKKATKVQQEEKPAPLNPIGSELLDWHHRLAQVTGTLSIAIGRRKVTRGEIAKMLEQVRTVSNKMEDWVK